MSLASPTPPPRFDGVIFDLDGTLLDTLADIGNAANAVLAERGFPEHSLSEYRFLVGDGVRTLFQRALPQAHSDPAAIEACLVAMKREYNRHWNSTTRPYDGIVELIAALKRAKLKVAVLSNKDHAFTVKCADQFFGPQTFDIVFGLRPGSQPKPNPAGALEIAQIWERAPDRIAYLGDTDTDMRTAVAAGMFPIGAAWGFRPREELIRHGARAVIEQPLDLLEILGL